MPVVADSPGPYPLAAFGRRAPIVLSQKVKSSDELPYLIPADARRNGLDYKVRLAVRFRLAGDSGPGFAFINLLTDGEASASVELSSRRVRGRLKTTYTAVALNESTRRAVRGGTGRADFSNYVLLPSARPGRHTLRFELESFGKMRFDRVRVEPPSGLIATRQPAQPLRVTVTAPTAVRPGEAADLTVSTVNAGIKPARRVRPELLAPPELGTSRERVLLPPAPLGPGRRREDTIRLAPRRSGRYLVQARVQSDVGETLVERLVVVETAAAETTEGSAKGGKRTGVAWAADALDPVLVAAAALLMATGFRIARRRRARARTELCLEDRS